MTMSNQNDRLGALSPLKRALLALEEMEAKLEAARRAQREPIAIVGIGCRFPGGATDPDSFWRLLRDGFNAVKEVPRDRWDVDAYYDPNPDAAGKMYTRWAACLDRVDQFEPQFFGIAPREAIHMDPQQRLLLEVSWEALEHAGQAPERLYNTPSGVFFGLCDTDYGNLQSKREVSRIDAYTMSGLAHSIAAGRLSYVLGLQGPSMAVDTACSSSLVAVHLACQSLRAQECRLALAGGVHLLLSPENNIAYARTRMAAFDGRCKTFDAAADGFVEGEGCGIVVLKRLSDAITDGDRILAVIRGSAVNQDGPSSGLTAPNGPSQEAVIREALARGGVKPAQIDVIEAHGTGTPLGDPIEVQALGAVLGEGRPPERPVIIGSVKTNIGHVQAAAGVAGLIKLVLALQHGEIPPHLHFSTPNPYIPWNQLPVKVADGVTAWPCSEAGRFGGVSAFGFSGTNAHIVVGEAPVQEAAPVASDRPLHLLTLSARTETALAELARRFASSLSGQPSLSFADVCFTANTGRSQFAHRLALSASSTDQAAAMLQNLADGQDVAGAVKGKAPAADRPKVAFLFTGQGSQYAGMGRQLYETEPVFRRALDRCAELVDPLLPRPLLSVLYPDAGNESPLDQTAFTQPALFAVEYALAELWRSWGIQPSAVAGHSVGEYVAACVAGVITLEDALKLVAARGRLIQALPTGGAMAAVFASESQVLDRLKGVGSISIAAVNAPDSVVISGDGDAVRALVAKLAGEGIRTEPLIVSHAFHSALMEPMLDEFERVAGEVKTAAPRIGFVSNVTGRFMRGDFATPAYWRSHVRGTVRFADSIAALHDQGISLFLEIGPKPTLSSLGSRCLPAGAAMFLPSLSKGRDDWRQLLSTAASLYVNGASSDWTAFDREYRRHRITLPTYPFERERYWLPIEELPDRRVSQAAAAGHPLLGRRLRSASKDIQFESELSAVAPRFLHDHQVYGMVVLPATAYMEIVVAAASEAFPGRACELRDLEFSDALVLPDERKRVVQLLITPDGSDEAGYQLFSLKEQSGARESWRLHAAGRLGLIAAHRSAPSAQPLDDIKARCVEQMTGADYYDALRQRGNDYGPAFQGVQRIWRGKGEALGEIQLPDKQTAHSEAFHVHPAVLDACFQLLGAAVSRDDVRATSDDETYLPVSLERFRLHARTGAHVWAHVVLRVADQVQGELLAGDISLIDDNGRVVAEAQGLFVKRASREALRRSLQDEGSDWLYELRWQPRELDSADRGDVADTAWLILADETGVGARLEARLAEQNARVVLVRRSGGSQAADGEKIDPMRPEDFEGLWARISAADPRQPWSLVHLWNLDAQDEPANDTELADACATGTASLLHLVQAVAPTSDRVRRLCILTERAIATAADSDVAVAQAPAWGLGRTISLEYPELHCKRIDLDSSDAAADIDAVIGELTASDGEDQIAFRSGIRQVSRLERIAARSGTRETLGKADRAVRLEISERGVFDNLKLEPLPRRAPGPGEVEIRIHAGGLNFRDVLNALGVYEGHPGPLGTECAGTIAAVGDGVHEFVVGQQVFAMAPGSFGTYVTCGADLVVPKPTNVSTAEAAGIPIAFLTTDYALNYLGRMSAGERVLIHAAAGGVGLAAVQLAQRAGAEIFATAGSAQKRDYLRSLGIKHIFSSRTLDFSDQVLAATGGQGVDIVLNSLNGEFIPKSLAAMRQGGRFLEIGKAGVWTSEQVAAVRPDVVYESIYMGEVPRPVIGAILRRIGQAFEDGALKLLPTKQFALHDAASAFRFMAQARHTGKIVIVDRSAKDTGTAAQRSGASIRPDSSYLITGGLGSLGLLVARRLASLGATHLVLMSRGEPSEQARAALREIEELGAQVMLARGDVASGQDVDRIFDEIDGKLPALRGIVHAAGVIDDGVLTQQRWDRFVKVMAPKVRGAWNLHRAVESRQIDFFVMFSSIVSLFGGQGQANYAAANAFLDGLAHHRRARGTAGTSINWGPWEAGMAATVGNRDQQRWAETGVTPIGGDQGLALLDDILRAGHVQPCVWGVDWSVYLQQFPVGQEPALVSELAAGLTDRRLSAPAAGPHAALKQALESTPPNRRWNLVMSHVRDRAVKVLGIDPSSPIEPGVALSEMGLDSLMAVELRNSLSAAVGRPLPATVLFKYPSLQALTDFIAREILGIAAEEAAPAAQIDEDLAAIAPLSDDEVSKLLAEEIRSVSRS